MATTRNQPEPWSFDLAKKYSGEQRGNTFVAMESGKFFRPKTEHSGVPTQKATPLRITGASNTINRDGYQGVEYIDGITTPSGALVNVRLVGKPEYLKKFLIERFSEMVKDQNSPQAQQLYAWMDFIGVGRNMPLGDFANYIISGQRTIKYDANTIRAAQAGQRGGAIDSYLKLVAAASQYREPATEQDMQKIADIADTLSHMKGRITTGAKKAGEASTTTRRSLSKGKGLLHRLLEVQDPSAPERKEWWLDVSTNDSGALAGEKIGYSEIVNKTGGGANYVTIPWLKIAAKKGKEGRLNTAILTLQQEASRSSDAAISRYQGILGQYAAAARQYSALQYQQPAPSTAQPQAPSGIAQAQYPQAQQPQVQQINIQSMEQKVAGQFAGQAQPVQQQSPFYGPTQVSRPTGFQTPTYSPTTMAAQQMPQQPGSILSQQAMQQAQAQPLVQPQPPPFAQPQQQIPTQAAQQPPLFGGQGPFQPQQQQPFQPQQQQPFQPQQPFSGAAGVV